MEAYEWAYWMEGKPATQDIKSPNGDVLAKKGEVPRRRQLRTTHGRHCLLGTP